MAEGKCSLNLDHSDYNREVEPKREKTEAELEEIQLKIDQIVRLMPKEEHLHVLSFLEYWLT